MTSEWSFQMLNGPDSDRFATNITMGRRKEAARYTTSFINAKPCDAVEVKVLAPTAADPMQTLIAECSDSTGTNSASRWPSATNSERCSTTCV